MVAKKPNSKKKSITLKRRISKTKKSNNLRAKTKARKLSNRSAPREKMEIPKDCPFKEEVLEQMLAVKKALEQEKDQKKAIQKQKRKAKAAEAAQAALVE